MERRTNPASAAALSVILVALPCRLLAAAAFSSDAVGTVGAEFLNLGVGARAVAMGEAYTAVADDAFGLYWNPAGMTRTEGTTLGLMHAEYLAHIKVDDLAFTQRLARHLWLGTALTSMDAGAIEGRDDAGAAAGDFRPRAYTASLGLAVDIDPFGEHDEGFGFGAVGKLVRSEIVEKGQTAAFDLGALAPCPGFSESTPGRCGLAVQNLGAPLKHDRESDPLPLAFKLGWAFGLGRRTLLSAEAAASRGDGFYGALGAEFSAELGERTKAAFRLGANSLTWTDIDGLNGVSAGLGLSIHGFSVDYAFAPFGPLGMTHRVSMGLSFGGGRREERPMVVPDYRDSLAPVKSPSHRRSQTWWIY